MPNSWHDSNHFWHNKRVLVTGGAGFLGTYIVRKLRERGAAEITEVIPRQARDRLLVIVPRSSQYDPSAPLRACLRDNKRQTHGTCAPARASVANG